jgi:hypothetical protein
MSDTSEPVMPCHQCNIYLDPGVYLAIDVADARSHCNLCNGSGKVPREVYLEHNKLNILYITIYFIIGTFIYFL